VNVKERHVESGDGGSSSLNNAAARKQHGLPSQTRMEIGGEIGSPKGDCSDRRVGGNGFSSA
jgi:hypothetical protein